MSPDSPKKGVKVLLVDDNPNVLMPRAQLLESLGCNVVTAQSAEEALEQLSEAGSIDLLVVDVRLGADPGDQSGLQVAAEAARAKSDLPIVAYTAYFPEAELPMDDHPEVARWFAKGSLRLNELAEAMEAAVELGRRARSRRGE